MKHEMKNEGIKIDGMELLQVAQRTPYSGMRKTFSKTSYERWNFAHEHTTDAAALKRGCDQLQPAVPTEIR